MLRLLTCEACSRQFENERNTARFCSATCRQRAHRARRAGGEVPVPTSIVKLHLGGRVEGEAAVLEPSLEELTRATLDAAGRFYTPQGGRALILARRLDAADKGVHLTAEGAIVGLSIDTGSMVAALSKAHGEALDAALRGATVAGDKVDELKARRAKRLTGA